MRRTQVAVLILMAGVVAIAIWNIYPLAAPLIAHHQTRGIVTVILNDLFTQHAQTPIAPYLPWIMIAIAFVGYCIISYDLKHRHRTTHGSAHHAGGQEARKYSAPRTKPRRPGRALQAYTGGRRDEHRLILGKYRGKTISLSEQQQYQHVLLTAPTGAGKSTRVFIPNLLQETGTRSLFIGDLKNELYQKTAGWLAQYMQVWLFAPMRPEGQGYNPLAHIKSVEDAQDFAACWVKNTGDGGKDGEFWTNNANLLITAMILHLLASEPSPPFARLADVLTTSSYEEIRQLLSTTRSPDARRLARQFLANMEQNERLVGSVMTDIGVRFQLLASPQARAATATNDVDFQEMIETPTAFYLSIPRSGTRRYRPLMAVLMQQMIRTWERRGTNGVACYLDEFTNLGHIPEYAEFISTARSSQVALIMAIQSFSQLDERYGKPDANTIKTNSVTHLLLPGAGLEETKYYSERIGDTTVATETINQRGSGLSEEITSSKGEARRRLMTPDELRTMPTDNMLMVEATAAPLILTTRMYFDDKQLADRADIPYQVTHVRPEPEPSMPSYAQGLPPAGAGKTQKGPPIVVDEAIEDEDDQDSQYILNE